MAADKELIRKEEAQLVPDTEHTRSTPYFTPTVDIYETENELVLVADMPGVKAEDLNINLENNILTLEGDVSEALTAGTDYLLQEFRVGRYWRQFTVGEAIAQEKIAARLQNGELKLVLPKAEKAKPKRVEIKVA